MRIEIVLLRLARALVDGWRVAAAAAPAPRVEAPALDEDRIGPLYELALKAYDFEHDRYEAVETKAARYLTVLALVMGAAVVKVDDLLFTVRHTTLSHRWIAAFGVFYFVAAVAAVAAVLFALRAMAVESVPAIPVDDQLRDLFTTYTPREAKSSMVTALFRETRELREQNNCRNAYLLRVSTLLRITLCAAVASVILYLPLRFSTPEPRPEATNVTNPSNPPPAR